MYHHRPTPPSSNPTLRPALTEVPVDCRPPIDWCTSGSLSPTPPTRPASALLDPAATDRRCGRTYPSLHLPRSLRSPADSATYLPSNPQSPLFGPSDTYLQNK